MATSKEKSRRIDKRVRWWILRWEFARRNAQVKEGYEKAKELRKQAEFSPEDVKTIGGLLHSPYLNTPQAHRERELCQELGLHFQCMIDPSKSYEELMNGPESMEKSCFFPGVFWEPWAKAGLHGSHLIIDIDLSKINSIDALKKEVSDLLQFQYAEFYEEYYKEKYQPESEKKRDRDFEQILRVGELKEQGLKNREIAEEVFPEDTDPDSAKVKVSQHFKQYKYLVKGGYKDLIYP